MLGRGELNKTMDVAQDAGENATYMLDRIQEAARHCTGRWELDWMQERMMHAECRQDVCQDAGR